MASILARIQPSSYCRLISALVLLMLLLARGDGQGRVGEIRTLLDFKAASSLKTATYSPVYWNTWNESDANPCAWFGVTCTDNHTVLALDFSGWGLWGIDVQLLSKLPDLQQLDLSSNFLDSIPPDIGNLTGLTTLDISQSTLFDGIPPSISECKSLRSLVLQGNSLDSGISNLNGLVNLQYLYLANNLFDGPFPKELEGLRGLYTLDLSNNFFNGSIPSLPRLSNLVVLNLFNNSFTAFEEHWSLGASTSLQTLLVALNRLEGSIPSSVLDLLSLKVLNMSENRLSGRIPFGFSRQLSNGPFILDLYQNKLVDMPADLFVQQSTSCSLMNLSHNVLTGSIPIDGHNYSCLLSLDLSHNKLSGPIPPNIFGKEGNSLEALWLQDNSLSGDIVNIMLESPGLRDTAELRLQNNLFTGDLTRIMDMTNYQLSNIVTFDLSNNELRWTASDTFPDPIQVTLETLSTSSTGLKEFRVGGNNFSGTSLPTTCFVNRTFLVGLLALDLSDSKLKGEISDAAFDSSCVPFLQYLNLSNNEIRGPVPQSIVKLPALEILDVSSNQLSGALPSIPFNSSLNTNPIFYGGNDGLCGYPLDACPKPQSGLELWLLLIIIAGSLTVAALFSCVVIIWQWRIHSKRHRQDADLIKTLMERDSATLMSLRELRKATDNFADSAQIGEGGFGTVYMGKLNDGTPVAIKRSKREGSERDKEQFLNEVRILSHVSHRNLVKLMGCCMENKIAVLVFEFVSNGTLQEHLQGKVEATHLTWKERLKIVSQTADALNYLHSAATFPIYHRDVKSANILLNDDLNAKVADFGISKLAPVQATHVSTMAIQGTMGYIDPEYYTSYQLTDKSDVYSFGVVLLELISAKPALDFSRGGDNTSLENFAGICIKQGELHELIDPALKETYSDPSGQGGESILNVGRLAMKCLDMQGKAKHERGVERSSTLTT